MAMMIMMIMMKITLEYTCPVLASSPWDLDPSFLPTGTSVTLTG